VLQNGAENVPERCAPSEKARSYDPSAICPATPREDESFTVPLVEVSFTVELHEASHILNSTLAPAMVSSAVAA
jgi:hypothetical protein